MKNLYTNLFGHASARNAETTKENKLTVWEEKGKGKRKRGWPITKRFAMFFATLVVGMLLATNVSAVTITAMSGGNWEDAGNWDIGVPGPGDDVIIGEDIEMLINLPGAECASIQIGGLTYGYGMLTLEPNATLSVSGNVIMGGVDNASYADIYLLSNSILTIGGNIQLGSTSNVLNSDGSIYFGSGSRVTVTGNMTLGNGSRLGRLDFTNGGLLQLGASIFSVNTANTIGTGTIEYNGGIQTVAPWTYNNLILSGTGAKSTSAVSVNGIITIAGTATVSSLTYITGNSYSTLKYEGTAAQITGGEFGQLSASNRTFAGSGGVFINNSNGVSLGSNSEINNTLTLTAGSFTVGSYTLILRGPAIAGTSTNMVTNSNSSLKFISNSSGLFIPSSVSNLNLLRVESTNGIIMYGNLSCYDCEVYGKISTGSYTLNVINAITGTYSNSSYVYGKISHPFATSGSTSSYNFPVGDASSYTPVSIIFASISNAGSLTVSTTHALHPDYTNSGLKEPTVVNRYWTVTNSGMVFSTYSIQTYFVPGAYPGGDIRGGSTSNYVIRRYSGGTWYTTTTIAHNSDNAMSSGLTGLSDFILGEGSADAARSTLTPPTTTINADNVATAELKVTAYDAAGLLIGGGGATVTITLLSGIGTIGAVTDNHDGTYTALVKSPTVGSGTFVATLDGADVKNGGTSQTQVVVNYVLPAPDLVKSTLTPTSSTIIADGVCQQILTVALYDINSNPVIDYTGTVTFSRPSGVGTFVAAGVLTPGTNLWTTTVKHNVAGTSGNFRARLSNPAGYIQSSPGVTQIANVSYVLANAGPDQSKCNNGSFTLAGNNPSPGTGNWTVFSGTANIPSPTLYNASVTGVPAGTSATLRWTITENGCTNYDDVILNNASAAAAGPDQTQCNNTTFTLAANTPTLGTGAWSNVSGPGTVTTPSSPTSGVTGATTGSTTVLRWTITLGSCSTTDDVILINNLLGQVDQPSNVVVCNTGIATTNYTTSNVGGSTTYEWTNSNTDIGLSATGTGNISFTATNTTTAPITGTIVVTPTYTYNGTSCVGSTKTFTITVNPTGQVTQPVSQVVCNTATTTVGFATTTMGGTTTYAWTNDNTSIGLSGSGNGDISFTATNTGTTPITGTIVVTPTFTNGSTSCVGSTKTFTITVNPTGQVTQPVSQVVCNTAT
ncbi:MAG: invasin domain 3-containing protein, partial [Bacteroidota bacterium]